MFKMDTDKDIYNFSDEPCSPVKKQKRSNSELMPNNGTEDSDNESSFSGFHPEDVVNRIDVESECSSLSSGSDIDDDIISSGGESDGEEGHDEEEVNDNFDVHLQEDHEYYDYISNNDLFKYRSVWKDEDLEDVTTLPCTQPQGAKLPADFNAETAKPSDYLQLFLPDKFLQTVVKHTNEYVIFKKMEKRGQTGNATYVDKDWKNDLTLQELKAYIGLLTIFGLNPSKQTRHYWSHDDFLSCQGVKNVFSRARFCKVSQYLHLSDRLNELPRSHPQFDILQKARPILRQLSDTFPRYFNASTYLALDEGMIKGRHRVKYRQYLPSKPARYGIKLFMLCNSLDQSPRTYLMKFEVYLGKNQSATPTKFGPNFDVVARLTKELEGKHHRVFFDNYYSSVRLVKYLLSKGIYSTGTIRFARNFLPPVWEEFRKSKTNPFKRGWFKYWQDVLTPSITSCLWSDTKLVKFVSSMCTPDRYTQVTRRVNGREVIVKQPVSAHIYSQHYGAVDLFDAAISAFQVGKPTKKVWKLILNWCLNAALVNAYVLYKTSSQRTRSGPKKYGPFEFRLECAKNLIGNFSSRKKRSAGAPVRNYAPTHLHTMIKIGRKGSTRKCRGHSKFQPNFRERKRTRYGCSVCNIPLCPDCFYLWHKD